MMCQLPAPVVISHRPNDLVHTGAFTNIQQMPSLTINQKTEGRGAPESTESA